MENEQWLELLDPFTFVKDLVLNTHWCRRVAPAMQELDWESATEMSPALQNLLFEGPPPSGPVKGAFRKFIAVRRLSGRPVALHWL